MSSCQIVHFPEMSVLWSKMSRGYIKTAKTEILETNKIYLWEKSSEKTEILLMVILYRVTSMQLTNKKSIQKVEFPDF